MTDFIVRMLYKDILLATYCLLFNVAFFFVTQHLSVEFDSWLLDENTYTTTITTTTTIACSNPGATCSYLWNYPADFGDIWQLVV